MVDDALEMGMQRDLFVEHHVKELENKDMSQEEAMKNCASMLGGILT